MQIKTPIYNKTRKPRFFSKPENPKPEKPDFPENPKNPKPEKPDFAENPKNPKPEKPDFFYIFYIYSQGSRRYACWARGRRGLVPWMEILPGLLQCQVGRGFTASTAARPARRSLFRGVEGGGGSFPSA